MTDAKLELKVELDDDPKLWKVTICAAGLTLLCEMDKATYAGLPELGHILEHVGIGLKCAKDPDHLRGQHIDATKVMKAREAIRESMVRHRGHGRRRI